MLDSLKSLSSVLLLLCLFLPLSQCAQEARPGIATDKAKVTVFIPLQSIEKSPLNFQAISAPLLFVLPFVLVLIQHLRRDTQLKLSGQLADFSWFLFLFELVCACALAMFLSFYVYLGKPLIGLYLSASALAIYFIAVFGSIYTKQ